MPDAQKAVRKHMLQKTVKEFLRWEDGDLPAISIAAIPIVEADLAALTIEEAVIADGHAMRVTPEVIQQLPWTGKRGFRIDHPVLFLPLPQATVAPIRIV